MAYTNYTIVPEDGVVTIDGKSAFEVDMTGIGADVHAIQWYGLRNSGTIEYKPDSLTGELPVPGSFTDPDSYSTQVTEAEAIIQGYENPVTYYVTTSDYPYEGQILQLGWKIVIYNPNTPQPSDTTTLVPPTVTESYQTLYWYNSAWLVSSVDPNLTLSEAKTYLKKEVSRDAALASAEQAGVYSIVQLFNSADVGALPTADYPGVDLGQYQIHLDAEVVSLHAQVDAATAMSELYTFDPVVNRNPN